MSGQHAGPKFRKPGKREMRGVQAILSEMEEAAHDMRGYKNAAERKRADDIFAGVRWIRAALTKATNQGATHE